MRRWIVIAVAGLGVLAAGPALAQGESAAVLRQELEGARRELMTLRAELEALRAEHAEALSTIERMRLAMARGSGGESRGGAPGGGDRSRQPGNDTQGSDTPANTPEGLGGGRAVVFDPYSSPGALFVAASVSYSEKIWDSAPEDAGRGWLPEPGAVREWTAAVRREIRGRAEWLTRVRLVEMEDDAESQRAMVTILDPRTLEPMEEAFAVDVPDRFVGRFEDAPASEPGEKNPGGAVLFELLVETGAAPVFQPGRAERGPFNYPRFIGPYAGFGFDVVIRGVGVLSEAEARAAASETPKEEGRR